MQSDVIPGAAGRGHGRWAASSGAARRSAGRSACMNAMMTGAMGHHAGRAAEASVAAHYQRRGMAVVAERWRGNGGEVDLVVRDGGELVFIEVKRSRSFARAAERVSPRQVARIFAAASEYLAGEPDGQATPVRFDVALVNGIGQIEVLENALWQ